MASGSTTWTFTGLRYVYLEGRDEMDLESGFSLMKVNDSIRCGGAVASYKASRVPINTPRCFGSS